MGQTERFAYDGNNNNGQTIDYSERKKSHSRMLVTGSEHFHF